MRRRVSGSSRFTTLGVTQLLVVLGIRIFTNAAVIRRLVLHA